MSHMIADMSAELHRMAKEIGLRREWCQQEGTYREHYDVGANKRKLAIRFGAHPITSEQLGLILKHKREAANQHG